MHPTSNPDPTPNPVPEQVSTPPSTPTPLSPNPLEKKQPAVNPAIWLALGVALLAVLGFGIYTWGQAAEQKDNDVVITETNKMKEETPVAEDANTITTTLPDGKTATYADTEGNRNIEFTSSTKGSGYVDLSHKAVATFLSSADETMVTKLCGANGELAQREDIIVATMSTSVRSVQYPTENNCLDELATLRNTDPTSRAAAAELVKQVASDVRQFYGTVVIK